VWSAKKTIRSETIIAVLICAVCEILSCIFRDVRVLAFCIFAVLIDAMTFVSLWLRSSSALAAENLLLRKQLAIMSSGNKNRAARPILGGTITREV
jgi:hypothetical protein